MQELSQYAHRRKILAIVMRGRIPKNNTRQNNLGESPGILRLRVIKSHGTDYMNFSFFIMVRI